MGNNATIHYNPAEDLDDLNPGFVTFCVVLQSILCVVGGLGNILTLLAIILSKALHKSYNAYIAHLACMDLIICFAMIPSNIRAISGNHGEPANCAAIGAIALICLVVSILSLMMIGLNRYILICRSLSFYKKIYNKRMIAITFAVMWLWALAVVLPMLSFNGLGWSRKNHYCFFVNYDFITYLYVSVGLAQLGIVVPAGVTASCYVLIIKKLKSTARRLEPRSGNSQNTQPTMSTSEPVDDDDDDDESSEANRRPTSAADSSDVTKQMMQRREVKRKAQSRRILGLIMIFMFFVILWLPIAVTFTIDYRQQLPAWVYVFLLTVAWINSSVNVFLYGYTNQLYRHAFKCILTCKFSQINTRG